MKKNQKEIVLVYQHSLVGKKKGLLDTKPKKLMEKRLLILFGIKFVRVTRRNEVKNKKNVFTGNTY